MSYYILIRLKEPAVTDFYDACDFHTSVEVSKARLLCMFYFLDGRSLSDTEVVSILSTRVVLW